MALYLFIYLSLLGPLFGGGTELVFSATLDQPTTPGLAIGSDPAVTLEWTSTVTRTGAGAFHAIGGNITAGDADIINKPAKTWAALGGLECWTGGAFRFESFPNSGNIWIVVTVPTDGILGVGNKPTVAVTPSGKLRLMSSNNGNQIYSESAMTLQAGQWYYLLIHAVRGIDQTQQLYIYDNADNLLETLNLTLNTTGGQKDKVAKWGFGTVQNSTGLEYYLDDLAHFRGSDNPGPQRVTGDYWVSQ